MNNEQPVLSPQNNTPAAKGIRTFLQSIIAAVVAFLYGLWQLPGVSDYTQNFVETQGLSLLLGLAALVGIPAGVIAFLMNLRKK
jgi:hypothetical protein